MSTRTRAFTLIELLLVIAILAAIIGVLIVSMRGVRLAANRTESSNALRQMIAGYNSYSAENRQTLMPGYVDASMIGDGTNQIDLKPRRHDGGFFEAEEDISSYVWRLAPYLDHDWKTMMTDYRNTGLIARLDAELRDEEYGPGPSNLPPTADRLGIASVPSFGLNSIFVGGDSSHGGPDATANHPFQQNVPQRLAAQRLSEVRNPAMLLVFGPVGRVRNGATVNDLDPYESIRNVRIGYPELRPPAAFSPPNSNWTVWMQRQWGIGDPNASASGDNVMLRGDFNNAPGCGLPIVRWGARHYPVANLDGSIAVEDLGVIAYDMRRWSPFVTGLEPIVAQPAP